MQQQNNPQRPQPGTDQVEGIDTRNFSVKAGEAEADAVGGKEERNEQQ